MLLDVLRMCPWWFFFSSRRRHTRCSRDWSSDVCSSDLDLLVYVGCQRFVHYRQREEMRAELKERYGIVLSTRSEEHTSELQSRLHLVCRLLLEKKKKDVEDADALLSGM